MSCEGCPKLWNIYVPWTHQDFAAGVLDSETNSVLGAKGREKFPLRHVLNAGTFWNISVCLGLTHVSEWGAIGVLAPRARKWCARSLGIRKRSRLAPMCSEEFSVLGALESRISFRGAPWTQKTNFCDWCLGLRKFLGE